MGACSTRAAIAQCAEIEDLLGILGVQFSVFRVVNPGQVDQLIQNLRRTLSARSKNG